MSTAAAASGTARRSTSPVSHGGPRRHRAACHCAPSSAGRLQWRPEELLIGAVELGGMLRFLALAEGEGLKLVSYQSSALGRFRGHAESGNELIDLIVRPRVGVEREEEVAQAEALFELLAREPPDAGLLRVPPRLQPQVQLWHVTPEATL